MRGAGEEIGGAEAADLIAVFAEEGEVAGVGGGIAADRDDGLRRELKDRLQGGTVAAAAGRIYKGTIRSKP